MIPIFFHAWSPNALPRHGTFQTFWNTVLQLRALTSGLDLVAKHPLAAPDIFKGSADGYPPSIKCESLGPGMEHCQSDMARWSIEGMAGTSTWPAYHGRRPWLNQEPWRLTVTSHSVSHHSSWKQPSDKAQRFTHTHHHWRFSDVFLVTKMLFIGVLSSPSHCFSSMRVDLILCERGTMETTLLSPSPWSPGLM